MFRTWKSEVTDPLGMYREWSLDCLMQGHRTRMNTMIQEGRIPHDDDCTETMNPYVVEECGATAATQTTSNEEENQNTTTGPALPDGRKLYLAWLGENRETIEMNRKQAELLEGGRGLFAGWRETVPKDGGMFVEWRDGDMKLTDIREYTKKSSEEKQQRKEAMRKRLEAMSQEEAMASLLRGNIHASDKAPKKSLRLFISSTFCDTKAERNFLMRDTYPRIRDHCSRFDIDFQAVDFGWGQADASVFDNDFSNLCLQEMQRSKEMSLDGVPCVLYVLTDKYGTPGLPEYIEMSEYRYILSSIDDEEDREMVESWYVFDENAIPQAYRLQGLVHDEPLIVSPDKHERKLMSARWTSTESRLFRIMKNAVEQCYGFRKERKEKWQVSPFGHQVARTLDDASSPAPKNALCIMRNITQLNPLTVPDNNLNHRTLHQYVDIDHEKNDRDMKSKKVLDTLKRGFKRLKIKCKKYALNWSPFGINESYHLDYLNHLTSSVLKEFKSRIITALGNQEPSDELVMVVASHAKYCLDMANEFCGRETLMSKITSYLEDGSNRPLIIQAPEGSGKTTLIAEAVLQARELYEVADVSPIVIARFCSLQKKMSTSTFVRSVSQQIRLTLSTKRSYEIMLQVEKGLDLENLGGVFKNSLSKATEDTPLLLFFDSIDDLSGDMNLWFPKDLPRNVKLVATIQSNAPMPDLFDPESVLQITPMSKAEAQVAMEDKFQRINRVLRAEQMDHIILGSLDDVENCSSMYRLQLLFEMSCSWSSHERLEAFNNDLAVLLAKFLEKLELDHGKFLVAHCLTLLHLAQCGLSESHLLDILSADEDVLEAVLLVNPPPTKRFPPILFSRLRRDLGKHIVDFYVNGHNVMVIANRQLSKAIELRYIGDETHLEEKYHSLIADYYRGELQDRYPGRSLAPQPLYTVSPHAGHAHLNMAKLCELPRSSIHGRNPSCIKESLCNFTFIAAKCSAGLLEDLLVDYQVASSVLAQNGDVDEFWSFVKCHGADLTQNPELVVERALDMPEKSVVYQKAKSISQSGNNITPWVAYVRPNSVLSRITSAGIGSHFETMSDITSLMDVSQQVQTVA